jgi:methylmalonyl-CoA/ethylmalonyl-CoA epimerase
MKFEISLDHISYAVKSTDRSIEAFSSMYPIVDIYKCHDKRQNIFITFLSNKNDKQKIELIEPASDPSPVDNMLADQDSVLYHLCYRVSDFVKAEQHFLGSGFVTVSPAFNPADEPEVFASHLYHENIGLIEIIGKNKGEFE